MNYSPKRLMAVWPHHFHTLDDAEPYAHNPERLANFIYGEVLGHVLGNTEEGDGYKFRGRGLMQLTGRAAYKRIGDALQINLLENPDLALGAAHSAEIALYEWSQSRYHGQSCNQMADDDDIVGITYAVNGGQINIDERRLWLTKTKRTWLGAASPGSMLSSRAVANAVGAQPTPDDNDDSGGTLSSRLVEVAEAEWQRFGSQQYDLSNHATHLGHKEGEDPYWRRIGEYWKVVNFPSLDGRDHDMPWSAAFISFCMQIAGAGDRFHGSAQHSVYISRAILARRNQDQSAGYWCYRLPEWKPVRGDVVCWARQSGIDYDHQNAGSYHGHCDIVVEVRDDEIQIIGGNVGDSVTRRPLTLTNGYLSQQSLGGELLFGVMHCMRDD
jgi:predicted chitinase